MQRFIFFGSAQIRHDFGDGEFQHGKDECDSWQKKRGAVGTAVY